MIDRAALRREADSEDGDRTVVTRAWLKQVLAELTAADEAAALLGKVFGRKGL